MRAFTLILLVFSINILAGCSSTPTKSLLEERAGYGFKAPPLVNLGKSGDVKFVPTRVPEKVVIAWLHDHELPSKDYFWGSWLSIVVAPESWEMQKVEVPKSDKSTTKRTPQRPAAKRPKPPEAPVKPAA